ncbi:MAG TPA: FAD-dependent oxidoreductase [Bryobacteraceae bacterium]
MATEQFIVVGGGIAGLTAAVALAQKGCSVALYEQSRHFGGRAATQHQDGFSLNLGPHALYRNGPFYKALREWQIPISGKTPQLTQDAYLVANGRKYLFPAGGARLFLTGALSIAEKFAAARALQLLTARRNTADGSLTMRQWLDQNVRQGGARELTEAIVRVSTYCNDLSLIGAGAALRQVGLAIKNGVMYVDGGWETLVKGLLGKAESLGVKLSAGTPVERVTQGSVQLADGRQVDSAGTILAITPDAVQRLTGTPLPGLSPIRIACLDLGLESLPAKCGRFALGLDRPFYLSMHSAFASLAPAGGALIHLGKYLAANEDGAREELENLADLVLPGWRSRVKVARFLPNMIVSHAVPTCAGRPEVNAIPIPGVALAGDWVGAEAMLADAAVASALRAADFIRRREFLAA